MRPAQLPQLSKQPFQLDLFRLTDANKTNSFDFYEGIPRFLVGGDDSRYIKPDGEIGRIKRNKDGTALPIERLYEFEGKRYILTIVPALIKQKKGGYKAIFPGVREEIIEFIIHKIAIEQGFFSDGEASDSKYAVYTNSYRIQQELKKRKGSKHPSYNHSQINEALQVLSRCRILLKGELKGEEWDLSPLAERVGQEEDEQIQSGIREHITLYLELNSLIRRDILARRWRQIPYDEILQEESYLARWFRKRLGARFTYANAGTNYNIKLSTVINMSGISPYEHLKDNLAYVKRILLSMDIIQTVGVDKDMEVNPATNRKRMKDALLKIYPTDKFVIDTIKANSHHKRIAQAKVGHDGAPLIEPKRSDFATPQEYEKARQAYVNASMLLFRQQVDPD